MLRRQFLEETEPDLKRIQSVEDADKVIVMDNGKVVAFDTPENLLKNNKIYQEVYNSQVKESDK